MRFREERKLKEAEQKKVIHGLKHELEQIKREKDIEV